MSRNRHKLPGLTPSLSRIVLGGNFGERPDHVSAHLLECYLELGGNVVETAACYADGEGERQLGRILRQFRTDRPVVVTKGCHPYADGKPRVTPDALIADTTRSRENLAMSALDLFLFHRDDESVPVGELAEAIHGRIRAGAVRSYGVCNWSLARVKEMQAWCKRNGCVEPSIVSAYYGMYRQTRPLWEGTRQLDTESYHWHEATQTPLLVWSANARGWAVSNARHDLAAEVLRAFDSPQNRMLRDMAVRLAQEHARPAVQVSLAYVLALPFPVSVSIGPNSKCELEECFKADRWQLPHAAWEFLPPLSGEARE